MSGHTHAVVGANAAWIAVLLGDTHLPILFFSAIGAFAALLPDIEANNAKIHFIGGGIFGSFRNIFQHRGFTHSVYGVLCVFALSLFSLLVDPLLPFIITVGYMTHPLIDGLNISPTYYFYPFKKKCWLVPKFLRSRVGGVVDQLLFVGGVVGVLIMVI